MKLSIGTNLLLFFCFLLLFLVGEAPVSAKGIGLGGQICGTVDAGYILDKGNWQREMGSGGV